MSDHDTPYYIPLHSRKHPGLVALIDEVDAELVSQYRWNPLVHGRVTYAYRVREGKVIYLHRLILGLTDPKISVDHINHNGLDCRRANMRVGTQQRNSFNARPHVRGASRFKGVTWKRDMGKWRVRISVGGKERCIGYYADEQDAARAYNAVAIEIHGEFAYLNVIENEGI